MCRPFGCSPQELLGKKLTLRWNVQRDGTGRNKVWLEESAGLRNPDPITLPEANPVSPPFVSIATPSSDDGSENAAYTVTALSEALNW